MLKLPVKLKLILLLIWVTNGFSTIQPRQSKCQGIGTITIRRPVYLVTNQLLHSTTVLYSVTQPTRPELNRSPASFTFSLPVGYNFSVNISTRLCGICLIIIFSFSHKGPPEPVFNCTVSNHSTDAVLIVCQPGFHGGLPQNFSIDFYEDANSSSTAGGAGDRSSRLILHQLFSEPVFLLSSLKTNMRYKAFIGSFNAKGKSDDVVVEISTMKEPERQLEVKPGKSSTGSKHTFFFLNSFL